MSCGASFAVKTQVRVLEQETVKMVGAMSDADEEARLAETKLAEFALCAKTSGDEQWASTAQAMDRFQKMLETKNFQEVEETVVVAETVEMAEVVWKRAKRPPKTL